ncbi:MAG: hypothetical protein AAFY76_26830 [Cyanobacteria bacterium J06649_11]
MINLNNKVAIITSLSRGIEKAIAKKLAWSYGNGNLFELAQTKM